VEVVVSRESAKLYSSTGRTPRGPGRETFRYAGIGGLIGFIVGVLVGVVLVAMPGIESAGGMAPVQLLGPNMATIGGATIGAVFGYFRRQRPDARFARLAASVGLARLLLPPIIAAIIVSITVSIIVAIIGLEGFPFLPQFAFKTGSGHIAAAVIVVLFVTRARSLFAATAAIKVEIVIAVIFGRLALIIAAPINTGTAALLVNAHLVVGDHTEIVVSKLQIIFHLHPIAIVLGVLRKLLELVEHLRRIAARAAINPVKLTAAPALGTVPAPTATVIAIIVIQGNCSLISDLAQKCSHARPTDPLPLRATA
jgi:hypothetical protein